MGDIKENIEENEHNHLTKYDKLRVNGFTYISTRFGGSMKIIGKNLGINKLPQEISPNFFFDLEVLDLEGNNFTEIPPVVYEFSQLYALNMSNNKLISITAEDVTNLKSLSWLSLSGNEIPFTLPDNFGEMINLTHISLPINVYFSGDKSNLKQLKQDVQDYILSRIIEKPMSNPLHRRGPILREDIHTEENPMHEGGKMQKKNRLRTKRVRKRSRKRFGKRYKKSRKSIVKN